jgi:hypothetical protein
VEEKMKISLDVVENNSEIIKLILDNLKDQLSTAINKTLPNITKDIKNLVKNALINEPEYASLKAGTLKAEFGISDPEAVDRVVDAMTNTLEVTQTPIKITGNGLSGGFILTMIKSDDINGIIYTDIASVNDNEKGYSLPWLEWLLLKGNETIVQNYSVNYTNSPKSRSGLALMVKSNSNWRVPSNFVGTESNNWTTRAISKLDTAIVSVIQNNLENII